MFEFVNAFTVVFSISYLLAICVAFIIRKHLTGFHFFKYIDMVGAFSVDCALILSIKLVLVAGCSSECFL